MTKRMVRGRTRNAGGAGKTIPSDWYEKAVQQKKAMQKPLWEIDAVTTTPVWESVNQTGLSYPGFSPRMAAKASSVYFAFNCW